LLHPGVAGLLHPAADHEVRRVSVVSRQRHPKAALCALASFPRRSHTLRRIPLVSSRTASPRPLPSCRFHSLRTPLRPGSRLGALPTLVGSVHLPRQANLARGPGRSAGAARSEDPGSAAEAVSSGSDLRSCRSSLEATPSPLRTEARSGSGCRPPHRTRRFGLALAVWVSSEESTHRRPKPLGQLTPSCSLAEASLLAGDCTQSRDVVDSVEHAPRAWGCEDTEVSGALGACSLSRGWRGTCLATGVARHEPLCEAPRHRFACACWCGLLRCGSHPPTTREWLVRVDPKTTARLGGYSRARVPGSRAGPKACPCRTSGPAPTVRPDAR
jgi:hypothetical protein